MLSRCRPHWFIDHTSLKWEGSPKQRRMIALRAVESGNNNLLVVLVAGVGFFADSYCLFAGNIIAPMLAYVYWNDSVRPSHETTLNVVILAGCIVGMVLFGWLGDRYGRRKMYGIELIILIVGIMGSVMSSTGYIAPSSDASIDPHTVDWESYGSMNIVSWLTWWRFISGIGIGGDYPLSAVIASEFAPTKNRARMLAAVFSMQALGNAASSIASLVVVSVIRSKHPQQPERSVDQIWRWVLGLGTIPAVLALLLRLHIPESPRYTLHVLQDPSKAFEDSNRINKAVLDEEFCHRSEFDATISFSANRSNSANRYDMNIMDQGPFSSEKGLGLPRSTFREVSEVFLKEGNWRLIAGVSIAWFLLDFTFYGLGFNTPQINSKIWSAAADRKSQATPSAFWDTDSNVKKPESKIYTILIQNSVRSLIISVGAIMGSLILLVAIDRLNRKKLQSITFVVLGFLFIATSQSLIRSPYPEITITLVGICQFWFNFGPNSLTFIIPAEFFPTRYRSTCHGIAAASGKSGALLVQLVMAYVPFAHEVSGTSNSSDSRKEWLGWVILIFAVPMFVGAIVTYLLIPEVQDKSRKNKTLEELAEGRRVLRNTGGGLGAS